MKHLNTRFIISNIITAVFLFFSVPYYRKEAEQVIERGSAPVYAGFLLLVLVVGMIAMGLKSYDLACHSRNKIRWHGRLFLAVTYIGAFIANMFILVKADSYGTTGPKTIAALVMLPILVFGFIGLVLESHLIQHRPKKPLPKQWVRLADRGNMLYSSVGINLCWNHLVIGSHIHYTNLFVSILVHTLLMVVFVFSFQRLFWYEIMSDSETKTDNLKTFLAILLVFISGILPIYLQ